MSKRLIIGNEFVDYDYILSSQELEEKAKTMADCRKKIDLLEEEKKDINANFKNQLDGLTSLQRLSAKHYSEKKEVKNAYCVKVADFDNEKIYYFDEQTKELRKTRTIRDDERQIPLEAEEWIENNKISHFKKSDLVG